MPRPLSEIPFSEEEERGSGNIEGVFYGSTRRYLRVFFEHLVCLGNSARSRRTTNSSVTDNDHAISSKEDQPMRRGCRYHTRRDETGV